jgi:Ca-activated chloride channel family protein
MKRIPCLVLVVGSVAACSADDAADSGGNVGFGGAQDIGALRAILDAGGIPGAATLDANGFFTEHYVELPAPSCGQTLCAHGVLSVGRAFRTGAAQQTLFVAMNTSRSADDLEDRPLNLAVVIDTSGSMAADGRLEFATRGLHLLIDQLGAEDQLAIIAYDSEVRTVAELAAVDREALHAAIDELQPAGATNLHGGLEAGMARIAAAFDPARQNRVILMSDGLATAGVLDDAAILAMASAYIGDGIGLTTIGVGLDFNVALMRGLAERGAGNFYFLEDPAAVTEVFIEELDYLVEPIALDLELDVVPGAGYALGEVLGTSLWRASGDGGQLAIPAAFLASRTRETAPEGRRGGGSLLAIALAPTAKVRGPAEVASLRLGYRVPGDDQRYEQYVRVVNPLEPGSAPEDPYLSSRSMLQSYAMYNIFLGLRDAAELASYDYACALAELDALEVDTAAWNARYESPEIAADLGLIRQFAGNLRETGARADWCGDYVDYPDDVDYYDSPFYCSAGGGAGGGAWPVALAVVGLIGVRRRRVASRPTSGG